MRGPDDFDKLSDADRDQVKKLESDVEKWFDEGHHTYMVNTNEPRDPVIPRKVWAELIRQAKKAGWVASLQGAMVNITKPQP